MKLLACNSNLALSEEIATILNIPLTKASIKKFSDEEIFVEVNENVRGQAADGRSRDGGGEGQYWFACSSLW